jgi:hypothetical protein
MTPNQSYCDLNVIYSVLRSTDLSQGKQACLLTTLPSIQAFRMYNNFFNSHSGGCCPDWVHSALRTLIGLLYAHRVIVRMENLVE